MGQERRKDIAKFEGSRVRASMMFQPCFLAVEKKERMSAKSIAPSGERKPPEIFCRSFIMRPSRRQEYPMTDECISPLRQRMIEDMSLRHFR